MPAQLNLPGCPGTALCRGNRALALLPAALLPATVLPAAVLARKYTAPYTVQHTVLKNRT